MASASVWGIDLGKSALKAVRMRAADDELEIQAVALYEYEIGDDGTIAPSEASRALDDLVADHPEIRKEAVYVSLPGHTAFSRFIKLPPFDERKLAEMVRFEAQQQIPFPIEEVVWDYALIDREYEDDEEREVGLFAIKRELVDTFLSDLSLSGLEPEGLTIAPLATYNYVMFDVEPDEDKLTLVLDVGWEHSDLIVVDGERYWIRNLALNGHELTKAIAQKLRMSFGAAEELKRNVATSPAQAKAVYQATTLVLRDFVAEIQRSLGFYKSQNRGRRLELGQVLLLGRGARLPNFQPFFQKELRCPVVTVQQLSNLALDVDLEPDELDLLKEELPSFCVALGLAIQGCGEAVADVDLLPPEIRQRKALARKKPMVAIAVALLWVAVLLSYFAHAGALEETKQVAQAANKHLRRLQSNAAKIKELKARTADREALTEAVAVVQGRDHPLELANLLAGVLPQHNDRLVELTDEQRRVLEQQGMKQHLVDEVAEQLRRAQAALNHEKTWLVESHWTADSRGARAELTVARLFVRDEQGRPDQAATLALLEKGVLADIRNVLPTAKFEGIPKTLYGLDPAAEKPPAGGLFGGASYQEYLAQKIVVVYPASAAESEGGEAAGDEGAGGAGR
ncbi:MAG: type IV pilus assembly protein PilM [Planctomycetota bacterium]|nr:MAG: type IV pilus assembly protein PilM [Planctomycetota bacterium]